MLTPSQVIAVVEVYNATAPPDAADRSLHDAMMSVLHPKPTDVRLSEPAATWHPRNSTR